MRIMSKSSYSPLCLSTKLISLLRYGDQWTSKRSGAGAEAGAGTGAGAGDDILKRHKHQSNLRPASVLSVAGQLIRSLEYLVTVDVSFIRYPRETLLSENVKRQGDTLPLPSSRIEEVQVINGTDTQRSLPVNIEVEVKDTVAIKLAKCCSMVLRSSIELLETPYEELKEAESKICNTDTNTNTNYKNKDKDKGNDKDKKQLQLSIIPGIPVMPVHYATAYMLRSSLISVSSVSSLSKNNCMSSIQTETKELLLNFRAADAESFVKQILSLIGKICSNSPDMIESFTGSTGSTGSVMCGVKCSTDLIDSLIAMPPRYFRDDRYSTQLLPVLSTLFIGRKSELDTLIQEQLVK